ADRPRTHGLTRDLHRFPGQVQFFEAEVIEPSGAGPPAETDQEKADAHPAAWARQEGNCLLSPVGVATMVRATGNETATSRLLNLDTPEDRRAARTQPARPQPNVEPIAMARLELDFLFHGYVCRLLGRQPERVLAGVRDLGVRLHLACRAIAVHG